LVKLLFIFESFLKAIYEFTIYEFTIYHLPLIERNAQTETAQLMQQHIK
jgi:hypothetical protein